MSNKLDMEETLYDAVIVGSGISGSILAKSLSEEGYHVLVLEAGPAEALNFNSYEKYLNNYYASVPKDSNSPYPYNKNALNPSTLDVHKLQPGQPDASGYFVQMGPLPLASTYTRVVGGTTMHWQATCLRMLPEDFELRKRYGQGLDWPIGYEDLNPYYNLAEQEIGVSADVEDQEYLGITFDPGYVFPMRAIPTSYVDRTLAKSLDGRRLKIGDRSYSLKVRSTPQGRNGVPNSQYNQGNGYTPVVAVNDRQTNLGQRCAGNGSCVPICPIQAKYNAMKTLQKAFRTGRVDFIPQAVVTDLEIEPANGRVTRVRYKVYKNFNSPLYHEGSARGRIFILAANAVENAKLLLASGLGNSSGLVGRNLTDHPYILTWGLMPEIVGNIRGPLSTSGIEDLRGGPFRRERAAFRIEIGNDGWLWPTNSPYSNVTDLVDNKNKFGHELQSALKEQVARQVRLGFMMEQLPERSNRITIDPAYKDQLGNYRPVIYYNVSDYTQAAMAAAKGISDRLFQMLGVEDYTSYNPSDPGYVTYMGQGYTFYGGDHFGGTHLMGTHKKNSVVDYRQRSWDHENLYVVGSGSMPTLGTSNPTLTIAAMCFLSAPHILADLRRFHQPAAMPVKGAPSKGGDEACR